MSDWKLHTPNGVNDVLPAECAVKKEIENTIWTVFASFGYKEVETPSFEYYDCYSGERGQITQEKLYKFFDEQGRILALRPDFTTSIARMAATKASNEITPIRYMYTGSVYRAEHTEGVRNREITQSGIELIGSYSPKADAEVIVAAMEAVTALGIDEFSMEIGQVGFFNGLVEQLGLDEATTEMLRESIDSKNSSGIKNIVDNLDIDEDIKQLMIDLPYLFGDVDIIDRADVKGLNETSKAALDNLRKIYDLLALYGFEQYISLDLGMLQSIDYYTGSIFKCYTRGVGFPIAAGGRYDNLMGGFGKTMGAVGCAIGINRIMQIYKGESASVASTLVFAQEGADGLAYELISSLRINGCLCEMYLGDSFPSSLEYAKGTDNTCILRVFADKKLMIYDLDHDETIETDLDTFMGYDDMFEEPIGEETPQDMGFRQF